MRHREILPPPVSWFLLLLIYVATFRVFATLPFENVHQFISNSAIILLSICYLVGLLFKFGKQRITILDILLWIILLVSVLSAVRGKIVFGQPFYFGLMAQRSVLLSLSGVMLISLLRQGLITLKQVERSFIFFSLLLLAVFFYYTLFVDPYRYMGSEFVTYSPIRGYRYRFQIAPVIMLFFYSLLKVTLGRRKYFLIPVLLIGIYLIFFLQSRTTLIILAITLLIFFVKNFSVRQRIRRSLIFGIVMIFSLMVLAGLGYTSVFKIYSELFASAIDAFIHDMPGDASSAIRLIELRTAFSYIRENMWLGNGFISNQWNGGWQGIFGYFYPVDIGILGNLFVYGLIGTMLIYLPYYFSLRMTRKIRSKNIFYKTCEYMLLFFFLSMFITAANIRDLSSIMILVCLIYYFRYHFHVPVNRGVILNG